MTAVALRVALLKQADVHCQLATAQETPHGDPNKAIEHYLTAMELLTCAVADKFQLADGRKVPPQGCRVPPPVNPSAEQRPPAFNSPLSEVYLQTLVQHKMRQYEERVKLLTEVVAGSEEAEVTTSPVPSSMSPYSYDPNRPSAVATRAVISTPIPAAPAQQQSPKQHTESITDAERAAIEAANPWKFQTTNNRSSVPHPVDDEEDIQGTLDAINDEDVLHGSNSAGSPPDSTATHTAPSSEVKQPRQAADTGHHGDDDSPQQPPPVMPPSVTRRFGQAEVANADEAFEEIFNQFMTKKEEK